MLALSLFAVPALSAWFSGKGTFRLDHEISFLSYANRTDCEADQGRWEKEGLCVFAGTDEVVVSQKAGVYKVGVSTVTTNAHMCEFEGAGAFQADGTLRASTPAETWNEERQEWVPGTCEVTVSYVDGDTVNVSNNGACKSLCGMRAELGIMGAVRAK